MTHHTHSLPTTSKHTGSSGADVAVIGGGVIGLSTALALADAGARVALVADERQGAASGAAAGLLAPSIGSASLPPRVAEFFAAGLAAYPAYLERLQSIDPNLRLITGLIEVGGDSPHGRALTSEQVAQLEPDLHAPRGARLHEPDAAIDIGRLLAALRRAASAHASIQITSTDPAVRVDPDAADVSLQSGRKLRADFVVLAAGAWAPAIEGLPRRLPVFPLKGQMLALASETLRHPVMGEDVYLVPRAGELAIGATVERAGFDLSTDDGAIDGLRVAATRLMPSLAGAREIRRWAGLRPATPDMLPIIGPDLDHPRLLYACGHSKNGILLAPATAACMAALGRGGVSPLDIESFALSRFPTEVTPE